jgi:glutaredoxin
MVPPLPSGWSAPERLTLVYATWCPHCVPISVERATRLSERLGVPVRLLDIDVGPEEEAADELVRAHGDWSDDYLIPQLFLEGADGDVHHLLTGVPGPVAGTAAAWDRLERRANGWVPARNRA